MQNQLIAWRRYHGITQKEMAAKIGVDLRTYQNKEYGVTQFKADEMFAISSILDKNISELFSPTTNFDESEKGEVGSSL